MCRLQEELNTQKNENEYRVNVTKLVPKGTPSLLASLTDVNFLLCLVSLIHFFVMYARELLLKFVACPLSNLSLSSICTLFLKAF